MVRPKSKPQYGQLPLARQQRRIVHEALGKGHVGFKKRRVTGHDFCPFGVVRAGQVANMDGRAAPLDQILLLSTPLLGSQRRNPRPGTEHRSLSFGESGHAPAGGSITVDR